MLRVKYLLRSAPLEMLVLFDQIDEVTTGHAQQSSGVIHPDWQHGLCPLWQGGHVPWSPLFDLSTGSNACSIALSKASAFSRT